MRLPVPFAKALIENYAQNHWTIINGASPALHQNPFYPNTQDSRSVWFSLSALKKFICEFENYTTEDQLGVRVYFGEYSADILQYDPHATQEYIGLHTVMMIPTLLGNDGLNHDFDPQTGSSDFSHSTTICAMNHGSLCPPPFHLAQNVGQDFMLYADQ